MSNFKTFVTGVKNSVIFRICVIGIIILVMLIPFNMIISLINERQNRRNDVVKEINSMWAYNQKLTGPVIDIPYKVLTESEYTDDSGKKRIKRYESINYAHFLPEKLDIKGVINPEIRKRGIYEVVVYSAVFEINGFFPKPDITQLDISEKDVKYDDVTMSLGITDMRGIFQEIELSLNGRDAVFEPGLKNKDLFSQGVNSRIRIDDAIDKYSFDIRLSVKGSEMIRFLPLGKDTSVHLESSWKSPSFKGVYSPQTVNINEDGFSADWRIFEYNREFPQQWKNTEWSGEFLENTAFNVELYTPADEYQKTTRSVKYAILFIFLTFLAFFILIELILKRRIHPIQYLMIGFALSMFYLLLISLSEHIPFDFAYIISTVSIVSVILVYTYSLARKIVITTIAGFLLTGLYTFLFVTLQHEEYSLLIGSIGLFLILSVIMIFTRKYDWYKFSLEKKE